MIDSEHAVKRIGQLSQLCYRIFKEQEDEAKQEVIEAQKNGFDIEERPVVIHSSDQDGLYWKYHRLIQFYSQFL